MKSKWQKMLHFNFFEFYYLKAVTISCNVYHIE